MATTVQKLALLICGFALLLVVVLAVALWPAVVAAQGGLPVSIIGRLVDNQGQPIEEASLILSLGDKPLASPHDLGLSRENGAFVAHFEVDADDFQRIAAGAISITIHVQSPGRQDSLWQPGAEAILVTPARIVIDAGELVLPRAYGLSFWLALAIFAATVGVIVFERLHRTTAALLGAAGILMISHTVGYYLPQWRTLTFEQAIGYVDLEVIFLLLGMMTIIAILEETGIFQWFAFAAYRASGGRPWLLAALLMMVTAVLSALLDNVTTVLLISPITIEIALQMGLDPLSLLIPEVLACNIGGAATLIGDPPNILIASYAGLTFNDFLGNMAPGVAFTLLALIPLGRVAAPQAIPAQRS